MQINTREEREEREERDQQVLSSIITAQVGLAAHSLARGGRGREWRLSGESEDTEKMSRERTTQTRLVERKIKIYNSL